MIQQRLLTALKKCNFPLKPEHAGSTQALARYFTGMWQMQSAAQVIVLRSDQTNNKPATATVIFAHGLGDTGHGWADAFSPLVDAMPHIQFIFPTARHQPVTINGGAVMPSWYDIKSLGNRGLAEDTVARGLMESATFLQAAAVVAMDEIFTAGGNIGTKANRVVIGGFSQGAATSVLAAHTFEEKLGGVIALSGYVNGMSALREGFREENADVPLFVGHGDSDSMVPLDLSRQTFEALKALRKGDEKRMKCVTYKGMDHCSCPQEMRDVEDFLKTVLPPVEDTIPSKL